MTLQIAKEAKEAENAKEAKEGEGVDEPEEVGQRNPQNLPSVQNNHIYNIYKPVPIDIHDRVLTFI